jgi:hypothetical protein
MKKTWILAVLGLSVIGVVSSYGQGHINFSNYANSSSPTIKYAASNVPNGKAGLTLGGSFYAELFWGNGAGLSVSQLALLPGSQDYFGFDGPSANSDPDGGSALTYGAGWFQNISLTFSTAAGYTGGQVTLDVFVYNTANTVGGSSGVFNFTPATGSSPVPSIAGSMPNFTVQNLAPVPEPAALALSGLGGAALLALRRKKM